MHSEHGKAKRVVRLAPVGGREQLPLEGVVVSIAEYLEGLDLQHTVAHIQLLIDINLFLKTLYSEGFVATNIPDELKKAENRLYEREDKLGAGGIYEDHEIVPSVSKMEFGQILSKMGCDLKIMQKHAHFFVMDNFAIGHIASEWLKNANAQYRSGKWMSQSTYPESGLNKIALVTRLMSNLGTGHHFDQNLLDDIGVLERMIDTYATRLEKQKEKKRHKVTYTPSNIRTQVNLIIHDLKPFNQRRKHG